MAYTIGEDCTGCGLCARKCPAQCITGAKKERHTIDSAACIDCDVCASYCPVGCITDNAGSPTTGIKPKERPLAVVDETYCSGCELCVGICPFHCIEMIETSNAVFPVAKVVTPKNCVGCRLCVSICAKDAIIVRWPDGKECKKLNERLKLKNAE